MATNVIYECHLEIDFFDNVKKKFISTEEVSTKGQKLSAKTVK